MILHSAVWEAIRMHDLNYFTCFFLSTNWLHSACQGPEDAASPHGPDPASLGVSTCSALRSSEGMVPVLGSPQLGCSSWPLPCPSTSLSSDLVFKQGQAPCRKESRPKCKPRSMTTQLSSHQWSSTAGLQRARISPWGQYSIYTQYKMMFTELGALSPHPCTPKKGCHSHIAFVSSSRVHASGTLQIYHIFLLQTSHIFPRKMKTSLEKERITLNICTPGQKNAGSKICL